MGVYRDDLLPEKWSESARLPAGGPRAIRRRPFTEEQIIGILKQAEAGAKPGDVRRRHDISENSYYRWKRKYADLEVNEARRLRQLED